MDIVIFHVTQSLTDTGAAAESQKSAALRLCALRWRDGITSDKFDSVNTAASTDNAISEETLLAFLKFMEGRTLASFLLDEQMDALQELCESAGYVLPTVQPALDLAALGRILYPTTDVDVRTLLRSATAAPMDSTSAEDVVARSATRTTEFFDRALQLPFVTLQQLARLGGLHTASLGAWWQAAADERFRRAGSSLPDSCEQIHQLAFSKPAEVRRAGDVEQTETAHEVNDDLAAEASRLLGSNSPLTSVLPGFKARKGQLEMVQAVAEALAGDMHLLAEAGTGTGKSLAYLIPAALFSLQNDTRVVVSTHTISLQDQIAKRDFPVLRQVIGHPLSLSVFKGRTHYICMRKLFQEVRAAGLASAPEEIEVYMKLLVWLPETAEGNREELAMSGKTAEVWPRMQSETETCINKRCPFFKPCYYFRARSRAYDANVVVTNHSLVFSDLKADHRVLPRYDQLILDEAHHLEEEATKHLGDEVHLWQCSALIGRLSRDNGKHGVIPELSAKLLGTETPATRALPILERMGDTLRSLRVGVEDAFHTICEWIPDGATEVRITRAVEGTRAWSRYAKIVDDLRELLQELEADGGTLTEIAESEPDEELSGRLFDAAGFLLDLYGKVSLLCSLNGLPDDWVVWIETSGQGNSRNVSLHRAPVDVAGILRSTLFESKGSVVLTSATLSSGGSFDYAKLRLGLDDAERDGRLLKLSVSSPFRYDRQALLCVPTDVPELAKMSAAEAAVWLSDSLYQYAAISGGRLLALFTSHAMLRATAEQLRQPLQQHGMNLYAQGVDGNRSYLLEAFKAQPNSVLLGAQSFWEGIDLPGDQLRTLVIVRLPFAPPTHPVTQARHERLAASGLSPFTHDSLPEAVVRFRQGFGRLIRTVSDVGVVVVMDKRIVTSRYGSEFIKSVPGVQKCIGPERQVLDKMTGFLQANPS